MRNGIRLTRPLCSERLPFSEFVSLLAVGNAETIDF
jgi:hypothetical protein